MQMVKNPDGNIRLSALKSLEFFPPKLRLETTFSLLDDPLKIVRIEAARQLSLMPQGELDKNTQKILLDGIREYKKTLLFNADRPESQTALAQLYTSLNQPKKAELAYKEALVLQPKFIPAYVNYAYYLQSTNNENKALEILQKRLKAVPKSAALHHSLGLWHIRKGEYSEGVRNLKLASGLDINNANYQYVYAVALSEKNTKKAIKVLERSLKKHTGDIRVLFALAHYHQQLSQTKQALLYKNKAERLSQFTPEMPK